MSHNKSKDKGTRFEKELAEELESKIRNSIWIRIVGSGAMGTSLHEPLLVSDIKGEVKGFYKKFRGEAKSGYNSSTNREVKQFTIKKEWLDKIQEEAQSNFSFPILGCKFDNVRTGVKKFIVLNIDDFAELINKITELQEMLEDENNTT
jgi:hypothetical protein